MNGSLRPPNVPVSQPCAGQIDGVADASASRRSTSLRSQRRRFYALQQIAQDTKRVFGRGEGRGRNLRHRRTGDAAAAGCPRFHDRRQLGHRARLGRIERRTGAQIVDDALERLNLRRQFAGGGAIAAVLDLQHRVGVAELVEFLPRTPFRAESHQNRQRQHSGDREDRRTHVDRQLAQALPERSAINIV